MFTEELEDLKNRYLSRLTLHMVFSQEATDLPLYNGRLDRTKIGEFLAALVDAEASTTHSSAARTASTTKPRRRCARPGSRRSGSTSSASAFPTNRAPASAPCSRRAKATPPTRA